MPHQEGPIPPPASSRRCGRAPCLSHQVSSFKFHYWPLVGIAPAQYQQYKDRSGKARPSARTLGRHPGIRTWDVSTHGTNTRVVARVVQPSTCMQVKHANITTPTRSASGRYRVSIPPGAARAAQARTSGNAKGAGSTRQGVTMSCRCDAARSARTKSVCHIRSARVMCSLIRGSRKRG